jgi:hypothetical protein
MTAPVGFSESSTHPSAQILDSAAALVRAEAKLLWFHAQKLGKRLGVALGLTWLAMMLTQIALFLLALSPVIAAAYGAAILAASVAPSVVLAAIAWGVCAKSWLGLGESSTDSRASAPSLGLSSSELGRR